MGRAFLRKQADLHCKSCSVCARFKEDFDEEIYPVNAGMTLCSKWRGIRYRHIKGICGICKEGSTTLETSGMAPYLPPLLQEFMKSQTVCLRCKNCVREVVNEEWGLCWQTSSDNDLKWAMCDWLAGHYWREHFRFAQEGFATGFDFYDAMAKREGWHPSCFEDVPDTRVATVRVVPRKDFAWPKCPIA